MRTFNSLQVVAIFAASPHVYRWLEESGKLNWGTGGCYWVVYVFLFGLLTYSVYETTSKD